MDAVIGDATTRTQYSDAVDDDIDAGERRVLAFRRAHSLEAHTAPFAGHCRRIGRPQAARIAGADHWRMTVVEQRCYDVPPERTRAAQHQHLHLFPLFLL
jgi:hypothetical protein